MAKAEKIYEQTVTGVRLELTLEETKAIGALLHRTGGSPSHSARKYAEQVGAALSEAGIPPGNHFPIDTDNRAIYFRDGLASGDYSEY